METVNPPRLFTPLKLRELVLRNRITMSPMCQYSAVGGVPNSWHLVHLGSRAAGGAGLVIAEATAVSPEGRISPADLGLWNQLQLDAFRPITEFVLSQGAAPGIQLAHAGRKASTNVPWKRNEPLAADSAWQPVAPSSVPFSSSSPLPREMSPADIEKVVDDFKQAAVRSLEAGFRVVEIHMAHGYLLHEFLSPLSNHRRDAFGGSLENRMRLPLKVAKAVREAWPAAWPVFVRISATDWAEGGWDIGQSVALARELAALGIDLIDCSSGALVPDAKIPVKPGYQVEFADRIRKEARVKTAAVGLITDARQAEDILARGQADLVMIGRELLRNPHWPLQAARDLGTDIGWPLQYDRAR